MKLKLFILWGLSMYSNIANADDIAIKAVKAEPNVIAFLANKSASEYHISFDQADLGGQCGYAGCHWRKLVTLVVTSKKANALSETIMALVEGDTPEHGRPLKVKFVDFKPVADEFWLIKNL